MASTTIVLKEPTSTSDTLIYLLFRVNNQRLKYSTGQKIHPKLWNADKQRAKETRQNPKAAELNMLLGNHENAAMDIYRRIINDGDTPTLSAIKKGLDETFDIPVVNKASMGFFGFIEEYINTTNKKAGTTKLINRRKEYSPSTKPFLGHLSPLSLSTLISINPISNS